MKGDFSMFDKYESAYRYMFETQLEAADEDYLEEFESEYNPDDIDWRDHACKDALRRLLNELYQDRTDLAELIEAAGLDEDDLSDIGFILD